MSCCTYECISSGTSPLRGLNNAYYMCTLYFHYCINNYYCCITVTLVGEAQLDNDDDALSSWGGGGREEGNHIHKHGVDCNY